MKKIYLSKISAFLIFAVLCSLFQQEVNAQKFRWLTGGGSTDLLSNGAIKGEWISHMCTDDNGNVYSIALIGDYSIKADTFLLNQSFNASASDKWNVLLMKHDCNGKMKFAKLLECKESTISLGIAYNSGKVYVSGLMIKDNKRIGYDNLPTRQQSSYFLLKVDTNSTFDWVKFVGPDNIATGSSVYSYGALATDGQGNIHMFISPQAGMEITPSLISKWRTYDLKYDVNGNLLDVKELQSIDTNYLIEKVQFDKQNNRYYALFKNNGGTITRSFNVLACYNADGTQRWKDTTNVRSGILDFQFSPNDGIYYTGGNNALNGFRLMGMSTNNKIHSTAAFAVIGKIDISTGNPLWMRQIDGTNYLVGFAALEILPDKSIAALGLFDGKKIYGKDSLTSTIGEGGNPMLLVTDSDGRLLDWQEMRGSGNSDEVFAMTSDKKGNIYFSGEAVADMQAGSLPKYVSNGGNSDYFIGKYGFDCNCAAMATPTSDFSIKITDSLKKEVQFTFTGTTPNDSIRWNLGDGTMLTQANPKHTFKDTGRYTVCAKVMVPCGRKIVCKEVYVPFKDTTTKPLDTGNSVATVNAFERVKIYPNPATDVIYIDGLESGSRIELYDIVGRKAHMIITAKENEVLNMSYLPSGNYIIQLTDKEGKRMTGKVTKR